MLGALYGDVVGSAYEFPRERIEEDFIMFAPGSHFTDDSLMTLAVALTLVVTKNDRSHYKDTLIRSMKDIAHKYPNVSWGQKFYKWLFEYTVPVPLNSYGNGSAMRISPVGWVCDTLEETIELSKLTTEITHNHQQGIKGAEAVAVAIFMARNGASKEQIKSKMIEYYPELETMTLEGLKRSGYGFDELGNWVTCQGSVPQAICAFLESADFKDTIRKAVCLSADTDTQACIAGSIAEAYYGFTYADEDKVLEYFPEDLQSVCFAFRSVQKKRIKR